VELRLHHRPGSAVQISVSESLFAITQRRVRAEGGASSVAV